MDYQLLNTEITTDPLGLGYATFIATGNDQGLAELLNAKTFSSTRRVPLWEVKRHALQQGYWVAIKVVAASHPNPQVQGAAISAIEFVNDLRFTTIDMTDTAAQTMLGALVSGGVITNEQKADLDDLSMIAVIRAELLFGESTLVTNGDISFALRGQR